MTIRDPDDPDSPLPSASSLDPGFASTTAHARSELEAPDDPELGPPLPASAVVASALAGIRDRIARPIRAASFEVRQASAR